MLVTILEAIIWSAWEDFKILINRLECVAGVDTFALETILAAIVRFVLKDFKI